MVTIWVLSLYLTLGRLAAARVSSAARQMVDSCPSVRSSDIRQCWQPILLMGLCMRRMINQLRHRQTLQWASALWNLQLGLDRTRNKEMGLRMLCLMWLLSSVVTLHHMHLSWSEENFNLPQLLQLQRQGNHLLAVMGQLLQVY